MALLHIAAQWAAGCVAIVAGSVILTLVVSFFVAPEFEGARRTVGFLLVVGGLLGGVTWGLWDIGRRILP